MEQKILYQYWLTLVSPFASRDISDKFFEEIFRCYTEPHRQYHTPDHLINLLQLSYEYEDALLYPDIVRLAIFYHDIIYKPLRSDNEKKSATLAEERLSFTKLPSEKIRLVSLFIACTQTHEPAPCEATHDVHYFLDFDLSILGADEASYQKYTEAIRKEYKAYPDFLYNRGRKKVLIQFLNRKNIFLTPDLRGRLEEQARTNLKNEWNRL